MIICIDSDINPKTRDFIDDALRFFVSKLLPDDIYKDLSIEIEFDPNMYNLGLCFPIYESEENEEIKATYEIDDSNIVIKTVPPKDYIIYLKNKRRNLLQTLAHEAVHIKQFATGELSRKCVLPKSDEENISSVIETDQINWKDLWNKEEWMPEEDEDVEYDSPWEIEAYGKEFGLVRRYKKQRKKKT